MSTPGPAGRTSSAALPLLWRDAHFVALHKPAGWLVHRTALDAHETRIVVQQLRNQLGRHVYPVHRLDKGTCGVLLMALDADSARGLTHAFMTHQVHKRYLALVRGWPADRVIVDHPLRPDDAAPGAAVQPAQTRFETLARFEWPESADARFATTRVALVAAEPLTGRRHQIRRHLKHIAHPIIGDATHGKGPLNRWWAERLGGPRLWLHAQALTLRHPVTGNVLTFDSGLQLPPADAAGMPPLGPAADWQAMWARLRRYAAAIPQT